jgi:preprotein translocase SecF subunit
MKFIEITKKTNIDFIGLRNKAFILSSALVLLGLFAFIMIGLGKANESVDFTGGTQLQVRFEDQIATGDLRKALTDGGISDIQIQQVSGTKEFFIRTKLSDTDKEKIQDRLNTLLSKEFQGKKFQILGSNMVGSTVGKTLKRNAVIAVAISMLCIIIYIAWRFTFIFGIAATIATFHDVLALLGIFYLMNMEINILFITALLTIAGYSLTDTVVVFDRIRENIPKMKSKTDFGDTINRSVNEVLSRTLVNSLTTLIAIGSILFLGGQVLFEFSLALFIGVLIGTYSSVFVASPIVYFWRRRVR